MKIYCIENKINNKKYVGMTKGEILNRFKQHKTIAISKCDSNKCHLHNAMAIYGIENFHVYELDSSETKHELIEKEKYWISKLDTKNNGYNETDGGEGGSGWKATEEQKLQNKERNIKYYQDHPELKEHLSKKSKEHWLSLSTEEQDKRRNNFNKTKIGNQHVKGKTWKLSEEAREKTKKARKGYKTSEETKKKLSEDRLGEKNWRYGKKHSPETKEKMRLAAIERHKRKQNLGN